MRKEKKLNYKILCFLLIVGIIIVSAIVCFCKSNFNKEETEKVIAEAKETIAEEHGKLEEINKKIDNNIVTDSTEIDDRKQSAVEEAKNIISSQPSLSMSELIEKIKEKGFTTDQAEYAAGYVTAQAKYQTETSVSNEEQIEVKVTTGQKNALKKAELYAEKMNMSKQGVYEQLTSEYGEKFSAEEAQYAIEHIKIDWNRNALEKAKSYQTEMSMSKSAIYDQLISEYGEKFTQEEAQYAIDHLDD